MMKDYKVEITRSFWIRFKEEIIAGSWEEAERKARYIGYMYEPEDLCDLAYENDCEIVRLKGE